MSFVVTSNCGRRSSTTISAFIILSEETLLITNSRRMKLIAASLIVSLYPKGFSQALISSIVWTSPFRICSFNGSVTSLMFLIGGVISGIYRKTSFHLCELSHAIKSSCFLIKSSSWRLSLSAALRFLSIASSFSCR